MKITFHRTATTLVLLAFACSVSAQVSDTQPPMLTAFSFTPNSVDVTSGPQTVRVTASITDNLSGVSYAYAYFYSPTARQYRYASLSRISGDALNGTYQGSIVMPRYSESGTWRVSYVSLQDNVGNYTNVFTATLQAAGFPTTLTVVSVPDLDAPQITGLSFSPSALNVSAEAQLFTMVLNLTDNVSGVDVLGGGGFYQTWVTLRSPTAGQFLRISSAWFSMVSGTSLNGTWRASYTMPQFVESGTWVVESIEAWDAAGNRGRFSTAMLAAAGVTTTFNVLSVPEDTAPPQLLDFSFSPGSFDTSLTAQTVTATFRISDNLAGTTFLQIGFRSPSGNQWRWLYASTRTAGTALDGTWSGTVVFPRYSEGGTWRVNRIVMSDAALNITEIPTADLEANGFPTTLNVIRPTGTPDGVVNPFGGTVEDIDFGSRASITFPPGALSTSTEVAIDVLSTPLLVPTPAGYSAPGTPFVNINLTPTPPMPFPAPGVTLTLPLRDQLAAGTTVLQLFRLDPIAGLVPAVSVSGGPVVGSVSSSGFTVTFSGVARLSTVVGYIPTGAMIGDVNNDGQVNCADMAIVRAAFGKRTGQTGYDSRADVNRDGIVDIRDLALVSRQLPAGTVCS